MPVPQRCYASPSWVLRFLLPAGGRADSVLPPCHPTARPTAGEVPACYPALPRRGPGPAQGDNGDLPPKHRIFISSLIHEFHQLMGEKKVVEVFSSIHRDAVGWKGANRKRQRGRGETQRTPETCEPQTSHNSDNGYKNPVPQAQTKSSGGYTVKTPSVSSFKESQSRLIKAI